MDPEWPQARQVAITRDGGRCLRCPRPAVDVHHRKPRGMGGSRDPDRHSPEVLICLCRACHRWIEEHPALARAQGWLVPSWQNAVNVPLTAARRPLTIAYRPGLTALYLTADGRQVWRDLPT